MFNNPEEKEKIFILVKILTYFFGILTFIFYLLYVSHKGENVAKCYLLFLNISAILALIFLYSAAYIKFEGKYDKSSGILIWHQRDIGWGGSFNPYSIPGKLCWLFMMSPFIYGVYKILFSK